MSKTTTMYFLTDNSDGDVNTYVLTEKGMEKWLEEHSDPDDPPRFLTLKELKENPDSNYWPGEGTVLIIRGDVIVPKGKPTGFAWRL